MNNIFINSLVKNKLFSFFSNIQLKKNKKQLSYLYKINKKSKFNSSRNHASIFFQSLGKNTFVTVLFKNKLIYNKSIGELKIGNAQIKKKEKRLVRNVFLFGDKFANYFFNKLVKKYKIKKVSLYFNSIGNNFYPLTKQFKYRWYGFILRARKKQRKFFRYRRRKFLKKRKFLYPKLRKKITRKLYILYKLRNYYLNKIIIIKSINNVKKISYNGCKNRKMKI
jgi:hypothetical protein